jgi:hypothetical protein
MYKNIKIRMFQLLWVKKKHMHFALTLVAWLGLGHKFWAM